ncbi:hypothetical protein F5B19DRAFT_108018 [Rostrohypoxylon terebratum]|nr:hypothetical protein F5B19DRAFT_108018 [Rostrohypoxylon terebratum]
MPPKRAASGPAVAARKRTKPSTNMPTRSTRWSAVSASANADADYKTTWKSPDRWYSYVTICSPIQDDDDEDDEEEEEEEDGDEGKEKDDDKQAEGETRDGPKCGKKHCLCFKPALQNPDHPWLVSMAGYKKYHTQHIHSNLRDPDNFQMYTFNDHASYGCIEIMENLFLDYGYCKPATQSCFMNDEAIFAAGMSTIITNYVPANASSMLQHTPLSWILSWQPCRGPLS